MSETNPNGINIKFTSSSWASLTVIIASIMQMIFFWYQSRRGRVLWTKLFVASITPISYGTSLLLGDATIVRLDDDTPFKHMRYTGWLLTCPIILLDLANVPVFSKPEPQNALIAVMFDQLMIVFGISSVIYRDAMIYLFVIASLAFIPILYYGIRIFYRTYTTVPSPDARLWTVIAATCFVVGWTLFPILFLLGPEGYKAISSETSAILHAVADLISKHSYAYSGWHLRWVVLDPFIQKAKAAESMPKDPSFEIVSKLHSPTIVGATADALVAAQPRINEAAMSIAKSLIASAERESRRNRLRILIVDDDPLLHAAIIARLRAVCAAPKSIPANGKIPAVVTAGDATDEAFEFESVFHLDDVARVLSRYSAAFDAVIASRSTLLALSTMSDEEAVRRGLVLLDVAALRDALTHELGGSTGNARGSSKGGPTERIGMYIKTMSVPVVVASASAISSATAHAAAAGSHSAATSHDDEGDYTDDHEGDLDSASDAMGHVQAPRSGGRGDAASVASAADARDRTRDRDDERARRGSFGGLVGRAVEMSGSRQGAAGRGSSPNGGGSRNPFSGGAGRAIAAVAGRSRGSPTISTGVGAPAPHVVYAGTRSRLHPAQRLFGLTPIITVGLRTESTPGFLADRETLMLAAAAGGATGHATAGAGGRSGSSGRRRDGPDSRGSSGVPEYSVNADMDHHSSRSRRGEHGGEDSGASALDAALAGGATVQSLNAEDRWLGADIGLNGLGEDAMWAVVARLRREVYTRRVDSVALEEEAYAHEVNRTRAITYAAAAIGAKLARRRRNSQLAGVPSPGSFSAGAVGAANWLSGGSTAIPSPEELAVEPVFRAARRLLNGVHAAISNISRSVIDEAARTVASIELGLAPKRRSPLDDDEQRILYITNPYMRRSLSEDDDEDAIERNASTDGRLGGFGLVSNIGMTGDVPVSINSQGFRIKRRNSMVGMLSSAVIDSNSVMYRHAGMAAAAAAAMAVAPPAMAAPAPFIPTRVGGGGGAGQYVTPGAGMRRTNAPRGYRPGPGGRGSGNEMETKASPAAPITMGAVAAAAAAAMTQGGRGGGGGGSGGQAFVSGEEASSSQDGGMLAGYTQGSLREYGDSAEFEDAPPSKGGMRSERDDGRSGRDDGSRGAGGNRRAQSTQPASMYRSAAATDMINRVNFGPRHAGRSTGTGRSRSTPRRAGEREDSDSDGHLVSSGSFRPFQGR